MSTATSRSHLNIMGYVYGNPEEKKTRDGKFQRIADCYAVIQCENGKSSNKFQCRTEVPVQVVCDRNEIYTYQDSQRQWICGKFLHVMRMRTFYSKDSMPAGSIERESKSFLPF